MQTNVTQNNNNNENIEKTNFLMITIEHKL